MSLNKPRRNQAVAYENYWLRGQPAPCGHKVVPTLCSFYMNRRYEVKCQMMRLLHAHKWDDIVIRQFFLVIDWMMALPPELAVKLTTYIDTLGEGNDMEYVSSYERIKLEQQRREGMQGGKTELLSRLLTRRFGNLPPATQALIAQATIEQIDAWFDRGMDSQTLDEVFQSLAH